MTSSRALYSLKHSLHFTHSGLHCRAVFQLVVMAVFCAGISGGVIQARAADMRESIAAVVNADPITKREVSERMKLVMASSELPDRPEIRARLREQILDQLIEEQLKIQEARRLGLEITEKELEQGIATVARSNNMSKEDFLEIMRKQDIRLRTLRRQVRAEIAWSKVIANQIRPDIQVRDQDIEAELDRLKGNIGKTEYLLAEIYLPFNKGAEPEQVKKFASNLVAQIVKKNAPFPRLAQQFSQSAAAARGGDLGWVQDGQLPVELDRAVNEMKSGNLSPPIKTLSGYHILLLRDKRKIAEETLPSADQIKQKIGMERLERHQRRYLLDLRSTAFIDVRS